MTGEVKDILLILMDLWTYDWVVGPGFISIWEVMPGGCDQGGQGHPLGLFSLLEVKPGGCDW